MFCAPSTLRGVLQRDLVETMANLRRARTLGDRHEAGVFEKRLDWLLDRLGALLERQQQETEPDDDEEGAP